MATKSAMQLVAPLEKQKRQSGSWGTAATVIPFPVHGTPKHRKAVQNRPRLQEEPGVPKQPGMQQLWEMHQRNELDLRVHRAWGNRAARCCVDLQCAGAMQGADQAGIGHGGLASLLPMNWDRSQLCARKLLRCWNTLTAGNDAAAEASRRATIRKAVAHLHAALAALDEASNLERMAERGTGPLPVYPVNADGSANVVSIRRHAPLFPGAA